MKRKYFRKKVCLLGAPMNTSNMGVSALAISFFNLINNEFDNTKLYLLVGNRSPSLEKLKLRQNTLEVELVNYRMSPKANLQEHIIWIIFLSLIYRIFPIKLIKKSILLKNKWLRTVYQANFIGSIHGGDGFSDIYGLGKLVAGILPDIPVILMGKKLTLLPQTYGPFNSYLARTFARFIISHSSLIISRDRQGLRAINKLYKRKNKKCIFCPDLAFTLEPEFVKKPLINPPLQTSLNTPLIGINVNGLMFNGGYNKNNMFGLCLDYPKYIDATIRYLLKHSNCRILLIPHTYAYPGSVESDPDACKMVKENQSKCFPDRIHQVTGRYNQSEVKGLISKCDFFIGSRMHACIAALSQGIPTIGIAYSKKFIGVFESIGMESYVIDARKIQLKEAIIQTSALFINRTQIKEDVLQKGNQAKSKVEGNIRFMVKHSMACLSMDRNL